MQRYAGSTNDALAEMVATLLLWMLLWITRRVQKKQAVLLGLLMVCGIDQDDSHAADPALGVAIFAPRNRWHAGYRAICWRGSRILLGAGGSSATRCCTVNGHSA